LKKTITSAYQLSDPQVLAFTCANQESQDMDLL